jgi:antitoxin (DNA-binding transcriptional repressor) of toxin-antitoxin stability system
VDNELTISVTEFKAKCLGLLERLATGDLTRVTVLKRGKPLAVVNRPQQEAEAFDIDAWRRRLQAYDLGVPDDYDWTQPMMTDEEAEQFEARVLQKVTGAPRDPNNMWS